MLLREGDLDYEDNCARYKGTPCSLTDTQRQQHADDNTTTNPNNVTDETLSYKQLDSIRGMAEDICYRIGDTCYIRSKNLFGVVGQLFVINNVRYADMKIFEAHQFDNETNIPHAHVLSGQNCLVKLAKLSEPIVTASEKGVTWFVSANNLSLPFQWFSDHLKH